MAETGKQLDIRCLCLDVDGVLTSGHLFVNDAGRGARLFHVHDGFAIQWFRKLGGEVMICSAKKSDAVAARMEELNIKHVVLGSRDKLADVRRVLDELGLELSQLAALGDDLTDAPVLLNCGLPIAPANAADEIKAIAALVTERRGGEGAVREAIEYLLKAAGRWDEVLAHYGLNDKKASE